MKRAYLSALLAGLVWLLAGACVTEEQDCKEMPASIEEDTSLSGCYLAESTVYVSGATLHLEAGTRIVFSADVGFNVSADAALTAVGTASQPIRFTAAEKKRGFWSGINFHNTNSMANQLEHVVVEYGGGFDYSDLGYTANVNLTSTGDPIRLSVKNCRIRHSAGDGMYISGHGHLAAFAENILTDNAGVAVTIGARAVGGLDDTSTYLGNDVDQVTVIDDLIDADQTWKALDVDYVVENLLRVEEHLIIGADAVLRFAEDAGLTVIDGGALTMVGTAAKPILLTGTDPSRGAWAGVNFHEADSEDNRMEHVTVEYGGASDFGYGNFANVVLSSSGNPVRLSLVNCTLRESAAYGLFLSAPAVVPEFAGNTLTENELGAVEASAEAIGLLDDSSSYQGNDVDIIRVIGEAIDTDRVWSSVDVPYSIAQRIYVAAQLQISAGAQLRFDADAGLMIDAKGALAAAGTADAPVVFTSLWEIPGSWAGINFHDSSSISNRLNHVTIEYGGGYSYSNADPANLSLTSSGDPVRLELTNSTIRHSGGWGLYLHAKAEINGDVDTVNTFSDNLDGDIFPE